MASPFSCASFSTFKPTIESEGRPLYYYFSVNDLSTGALLVKNSKYTRSRSFTNTEYPDETAKCGVSSGSALFVLIN